MDSLHGLNHKPNHILGFQQSQQQPVMVLLQHPHSDEQLFEHTLGVLDLG